MVNADQRAILEQIGSPAEVDREIQSFRRAALRLSSKHPNLVDKYPNEWVAVYQGRVRARGRSLNSLLIQLEKKGLPREHVLIRHLTKQRRAMILNCRVKG